MSCCQRNAQREFESEVEVGKTEKKFTHKTTVNPDVDFVRINSTL
jgi:hypothetical protein